MDGMTIHSSEISGEFFHALEQAAGLSWLDKVSMGPFPSNGVTDYPWIGQNPRMREWIAGRQAKGWLDSNIRVEDRHFEASIKYLLKDLRRDKLAMVLARIRELAQAPNTHWAELVSTELIAGTTTVSYDGDFFYGTAHVSGDSGTQSNLINVDISALPVETHGVVTAPSTEEFQQAVLKGVVQIMGFLDDQGSPVNEGAGEFTVMVPTSLYFTALAALSIPRVAGATVLDTAPEGVEISAVINPRMTGWTDKFLVFRTDRELKAVIRQEEAPVVLKVQAEGSQSEYENDEHHYGVDGWRNAALGEWKSSCHVTMT